LNGGAVDAYRVRAGLSYFDAAANKVFEGTRQADNHRTQRMTLQLGLLSAGIDAPFGTGIALILPYASLHYDDWQTDQKFKAPIRAKGIGDIEVRLRQDVMAALGLRKGPRVVLSAGTAAPTGTYTENTVTDLSIGRGAWWAIGEAELLGDLPLGFGYYALAGARKALSETSDPAHLQWGNEYRGNLGVRFSYGLPEWSWIPQRVTLACNAELLRRDFSTIIDVNGARGEFKSSGGTYVNVLPTLMISLNDLLSLTGSLRVPAYRDVRGTQPVMDTSYFVGVSGQFQIGTKATLPPSEPARAAVPGQPPSAPEIRALLAPNQVTLVDYWATWCEPCKKLGAELEALVQTRPDVALRRVDASEWDKPTWERMLPDAAGLPVLDIYGTDGKLIARLMGEAAFGYASQLPTPAAPVAAPPAP